MANGGHIAASHVGTLKAAFADPNSSTKYDAVNALQYVGTASEVQPTPSPDPRPILLFDLNGTLTSHTAERKTSGVTLARPGTPALLRLLPHFRCGN